MWLRDSSAQSAPYVRFVNAYPQLQNIIRGVVQRNARNVLTDPYANAFTRSYKIWEEKWEIDSLAYPIVLDSLYWRTTRDRAMFTPQLLWSFEHIVATYECEQQHSSCSRYRSPFLSDHGAGAPYADTGMIWGAFRPSDDPVRYAYNIPQELFAAYQLDELARLAVIGFGDARLAARASGLAEQIRLGVERYGIVYDFRYGWMYAYEVDGLGNFILMDDATSRTSSRFPSWAPCRASTQSISTRVDSRCRRTIRIITAEPTPPVWEARTPARAGYGRWASWAKRSRPRRPARWTSRSASFEL